jgi:uncharacterized protein
MPRSDYSAFHALDPFFAVVYEVHGEVLATGTPYDNRFVSIATLEDRKIVRWRDYMDSLAAWTALNKPA